jgi:peptidoglycan/xylan/chitin deacetylase (PgdA/CDA1 family)
MEYEFVSPVGGCAVDRFFENGFIENRKEKYNIKKYAFLRFPEFKRKAVTLSYDDGTKYDEKFIEILNKFGLKATFNINSGLFYPDGDEKRMSASEAVSLYKTADMK